MILEKWYVIMMKCIVSNIKHREVGGDCKRISLPQFRLMVGSKKKKQLEAESFQWVI